MARATVVVGYDDAELLDIACITSTLAAARDVGADPAYTVTLLTPGGRTMTCRPGLQLAAHGALEQHTGAVDTLVVAGGFGAERAAADPVLLAHVRRLARDARRVASVCTGAHVLAAAGLLDGRRATTHWVFAADLARAYPAVDVDPDPIFVRDGRIATSAGVTSALDLALSFVDEDHGPVIVRRVARALVTYLQRPGTQAQMSVHVAAPAPADDVVRRAVDHVAGHLDADLGAAALADHAGVSERHLARLFRSHLGRTPAEHVRRARTEAAAALVATSDVPLARVAARCGFRSTETMRTAFLEVYGRTPSEHRRAFVTAP
ncbi:transcriptional regulator GlxA family with amidase domain [Actinomycetospora succinea]|uniref:Transcriptional regulator GlxA family with amidase domain n=1 Tax=Actinomycetospora succinea TaxID=663603 RepID=A0A4R6UV53_9PSEU|nr:DJ-1/PfpI family protein [Actinomycetospora succinea]TDQ47374.1 transcriptional regulator GlxA family with amidase domain [Actinomycetospora succinea]